MDFTLGGQRMKFIVSKIAFVIFIAIGGPASAATIGSYKNSELNCHIKIEGSIEAGDARRLEEVWNSIDPYHDWDYTLPRRQNYTLRSGARICLSSAGGDAGEALQIVDFLQANFIGTAVESGATCLSACALIFMGGSATQSGVEIYRNRVLEPGASLGFHAFGLPAGDGAYTAEEVQEIFNLGMTAVLELAERNILPDSLFQAMLRTPSNDMMIVEYVGQAAAWAIGIHSDLFVDASPEVLILNACANATASLADQPQIDAATLWSGRPAEFIVTPNANGPNGVEGTLSITVSPFAVLDCTMSVSWGNIMGEPAPRYMVSHFSTVDGELDFTNHWEANGEFAFSPAFSFPPNFEIGMIEVQTSQSLESVAQRILIAGGLSP
jgi:hypothetical protein